MTTQNNQEEYVYVPVSVEKELPKEDGWYNCIYERDLKYLISSTCFMRIFFSITSGWNDKMPKPMYWLKLSSLKRENDNVTSDKMFDEVAEAEADALLTMMFMGNHESYIRKSVIQAMVAFRNIKEVDYDTGDNKNEGADVVSLTGASGNSIEQRQKDSSQ